MPLMHRGGVMPNRGSFSLVRVVAIFAIVLLACGGAYPQGSTARILGVVADQSGGYIGGAAVTVTDVARGVSQTLTTDSEGAYVAINLLPGTYTVHVEYKGFKAFDREVRRLEAFLIPRDHYHHRRSADGGHHVNNAGRQDQQRNY